METNATGSTFKSYIAFWMGQLTSLLGSSIIQFVIVWWLALETGSPTILSIAAFLGFLPQVILSPLAGVYIDRWNRKLIIGITDFLQAYITIYLIILFAFNASNVWLIILINSARGICQAFHFPAVNAIIPIMVPKKYFTRINGINYLFTGLIHTMGPVIGATLLTIWAISNILWIDVFTFLMAIIPLLLIKIPSIQKINNKRKETFKEDFKLGICVLKNVPGLLILLILISIVNFLSVPFNTLMPLFIKDNHSGSAPDLALVMALIQIGMISGALFSVIRKDWKNRVRVIFLGIIIAGSGYILATLSPPKFIIMIGIGGLIRAAMIPVINTNFLTIIQTHVSAETQGRVMSIVISIAMAVSPIGMIISGPIAENIGIIPLYLIFASLEFVSVMIIWVFTNIRHVNYEEIQVLDTYIGLKETKNQKF
jgi:DHA3 family macrolide efflux protein-like MFS transporter